jgi:hypothetical protein
MENEYRVSAADNQPIVFGGQVRSDKEWQLEFSIESLQFERKVLFLHVFLIAAFAAAAGYASFYVSRLVWAHDQARGVAENQNSGMGVAVILFFATLGLSIALHFLLTERWALNRKLLEAKQALRQEQASK